MEKKEATIKQSLILKKKKKKVTGSKQKTGWLRKANIYRIAVCHVKDSDNLLVINGSQIGTIIRIGHVCNGPFDLKSFPLIFKSVALNWVQMNFSILRRKKENESRVQPSFSVIAIVCFY